MFRSYPLISDGESLKNIIDRAGGLTGKALKNGISIFRDENYFKSDEYVGEEKPDSEIKKFRVAWKSENIPLMPGDSIIIKEKTGTINIVGEVYNKD